MENKDTLEGHFNWHWHNIPVKDDSDRAYNDAVTAFRGMLVAVYSNPPSRERMQSWADSVGNLLIEYRKIKGIK